MKILIVEDETVAYENLINILAEIDLDIEVVGNTESITQTIKWLQTNPAPDLILMDIHLSDGSAFSIFDSIEVDTAIIFTTAYDEYAIEAFKVNSVDYLLKPIKAEELTRALHKFSKWTRIEVVEYLTRMTQINPSPRYKDRLLIPVRDKLIPIALHEVAYFYTSEKNTKIYMKDGSCYPYIKTLEQISGQLNPAKFFRANKQFLLSRDSVQNITIWFDSRLLVNLTIDTPEPIYISKNKASEFKQWIVNEA
ncbi:two-component system response regulator LytT [Parabacteroides sp. PFB2-12]|uniref:LytR/AlgR family response regulator transcription factor n=1 Tax=unclassified Parabacteroides TaxID=2649774 RepID=UPI002474F6F3|nr:MULTISPECIES: LytTR family DNA-binding domain-containing protein [unclassified Parabacteroides]MDH6342108.1 two-component system response regulator LytT [Parabacteroides sp. PM6-13]MDH6389527.1 two-component system response regulator LytT [Parabacteroides sp. PFB2-12]